MNAGDLRHRVTIEAATQTVDSATGASVPSFAEWKKWYADVRPLSGRELERAKSICQTTNYLVKMRYCPGLNSKYRLTYQGVTYNIDAVINPDGRKVEHHVYCTSING